MMSGEDYSPFGGFNPADLRLLPCGHPESAWEAREEVPEEPASLTTQEAVGGACAQCGALVDRLYGPEGSKYWDHTDGRYRKWRLMD